MFISATLDSIGNWNPQLLRELRGRFTPRNLAAIAGLSIFAQFQLVLFFQGLLPGIPQPEQILYNRYCLGPQGPSDYGSSGSYECIVNPAGTIAINWQLWGLDLFITLSIMGVIAGLVIAFYLLCADLGKEESRGTLNFIRLSPRSARTILLGKLLGVPSLLFVFLGLAIPCHLGTGILAKIPLPLILGFYAIALASMGFWGLLALLLGLSQTGKLTAVQAFGGAGLLLWLLITNTILTLGGVPYVLGSWLGLFTPLPGLTYLMRATFMAPEMINYGFQSSQGGYTSVMWYGLPLFQSAFAAGALMLINYGVSIYWLSRAIQHRFRSPQRLLITKAQSYGLTTSFLLVNVGFLFQSFEEVAGNLLLANLIALQTLCLALIALLTFAISPDRPLLLDWFNNRPYLPKAQRSFWYHWLWGENSPALAAIAVNLGLMLVLVIPSLWFLEGSLLDKIMASLAWGVGLLFSFFCAVLVQGGLTFKNVPRSGLTAIIFVGFSVFCPLLLAYGLGTWRSANFFWLSPLPLITLTASPLPLVLPKAMFIGLIGNIVFSLVATLFFLRRLQFLFQSQSLWLESTLPTPQLKG